MTSKQVVLQKVKAAKEILKNAAKERTITYEQHELLHDLMNTCAQLALLYPVKIGDQLCHPPQTTSGTTSKSIGQRNSVAKLELVPNLETRKDIEPEG